MANNSNQPPVGSNYLAPSMRTWKKKVSALAKAAKKARKAKKRYKHRGI